MLKVCDLSLAPEGNFHNACVQLLGGCSTRILRVVLNLEGLALFPEPEELALGALPLNFPSLFVSPDNSGCVCRSALGLEVLVKL